MKNKLKLKALMIEDSPDDTEILLNELEKGGFNCYWKRVYDPDSLVKLMKNEEWDIVFCDYNMPGFSGPEAIKIIKGINSDIPVILVSGTVGEDVAVEAMRTGADDYLLKGNLIKLIPVVKRELKEYSKRIELKKTKKELESQIYLSKVFLDHIPAVALLIKKESCEIIAANKLAVRAGAITGKKCYNSLFGITEPCPDCRYSELIATGKEQSIIVAYNGNVFDHHWVDIDQEMFLKYSFDITERRNTEKALRESEEKYRTLFEGSAEGILVADIETRKFTYANPAICDMLCYTNKELTELSVNDIHPGDSLEHVISEFEAQARGEKTIAADIPCLRKNGTIIYTNINTSVAVIDGRKCNIGFFMNITGLKKAEKEIEYKHNLLRTLIDNMPDYIYVKDNKSRFILNNIAHLKKLGAASQEETESKSDREFLRKEFSDRYLKDEQKIIKTAIPVINREELTTDKDGNLQWLLTTKVPLLNEEGKVTGIAGIGRDITRKKLDELEITRNLARLQSLLKISLLHEAAPREILGTALNEGIALTESKFGFMHYYDDESQKFTLNNWSIGVMDICTVMEKPTVFYLKTAGLWGEAVRQKKPIITNDYEAENPWKKGLPDGHAPLKRLLSIPVFFDGRIVALIAVANKENEYNETDILQLQLLVDTVWKILEYKKQQEETRLAKEKAEESDRLKSAFLLNLSHEVRTPLNAIMGFSNLFSNQTSDDPRMNDFAEHIDSASRDLLKIIEDTIEMSKLESDQVVLHKSDLILDEFLHDIYQFYKKILEREKPEIDLIYENKHQELQINTNPEKLKKVLDNLIGNAIKFTDSGMIGIAAGLAENNLLEIRVKDTGTGIPEDLQEIIFNKFVKVDSADRLYRGCGLGLTISRKLVRLLGGEIKVQSIPGKGSVFSVSLPVNQ